MPQAQTPKGRTERDPALDGLRGVAILLVYLFHYGGGLRSANPVVRAFGYLTQAGWIGVELFFALSGFLITGLLLDNLEQPHALRNFFARRALRILPVYYGALAAAFLAALVAGANLTELRPLLLYAGFLQNIPPLVPDSLRYPPPLPLYHLWTLAVEEQFYLLWPFLLLAAGTRRRGFQLCLWIFALSCTFRAVLFLAHPFSTEFAAEWFPFLLTRGGGLALGGALALREPGHTPSPDRRWAGAALGIGILMFVALGLAPRSFLLTRPSQFIFMLPAVEIAAVALLALSLHPGLCRTAFSLRPLRALGRVSYGFYVLHVLLQPVFDAIGRAAVHANSGSSYQLVRLLAAFPITLAAAWLSYTFLERPILRLKRFYPQRQSPTA